MKLHSRNRKRKLEFINKMGGESNYPYSVAISEDSYSQSGNPAKRLRQNFYSQNVEEVNGNGSNGIKESEVINYTSMLHRVKHMCDRISENDII